MIFPKNIETKLGFDKIKELLKKECQSSLGVAFVEKVRISTDYKVVNLLISQTDEFRQVIANGESMPNGDFYDFSDSLERAKIEGVFLEEEALHDLKISLETLFAWLHFFKQQEESEQLKQMASTTELDATLLNAISSKIDEKGKIKDNATPELFQIRKKIQNDQRKLRKLLNQVLKQAINKKYTKADANITIKNGRMVIPVQAEFKRKIKGFVQDESASGKLVYLEPTEVLEVNNEIKELEYQERREVIKILIALTDKVRVELHPLRRALIFLSLLDFIRAKAKFAIKINGIMPNFVNSNSIDWKGATHPLLYLAHQELGKSVVPLDIVLDDENRILVISGPNAGGKSVCLKTVGLIQYMFQAGMLVPIGEESTMGVFKNFFIDIGDEQSIENDLSTYSSHLSSMKFFLEQADKKTLFLIDEFGTGTDPNFGGAIAEAVLEKLNQQKAFGVVNTHYSNLKEFAEKSEGVVNGAMRFDTENLAPLYKLEIGKPGSSFALEIAQKIGLQKDIIDNIKEKLGTEKVNFEQLLSDLEKEKFTLENERKALQENNNSLQQKLKRYQALTDELSEKRKTIVNEAKEEANRLLKETNQRIESTIRVIKEHKASKTTTKDVRKKLAVFKESIKKEKVKKPKPTVKVVEGVIETGSFVRIKGQETIGEVIGMRGKDVEIVFGSLTSKLKLSRLEKVSKGVFKKSTKPTASRGIDLSSKMANFSTRLDLRGKRAAEALSMLDVFIDSALLFSSGELQVVHGKGDGILRELVRKQLKGYKNIVNIHDEHADRGGAGVTIFELT